MLHGAQASHSCGRPGEGGSHLPPNPSHCRQWETKLGDKNTYSLSQINEKFTEMFTMKKCKFLMLFWHQNKLLFQSCFPQAFWSLICIHPPNENQVFKKSGQTVRMKVSVHLKARPPKPALTSCTNQPDEVPRLDSLVRQKSGISWVWSSSGFAALGDGGHSGVL